VTKSFLNLIDLTSKFWKYLKNFNSSSEGEDLVGKPKLLKNFVREATSILIFDSNMGPFLSPQDESGLGLSRTGNLVLLSDQL